MFFSVESCVGCFALRMRCLLVRLSSGAAADAGMVHSEMQRNPGVSTQARASEEAATRSKGSKKCAARPHVSSRMVALHVATISVCQWLNTRKSVRADVCQFACVALCTMQGRSEQGSRAAGLNTS